jgi:hypothetical protein
MDRDGFTLEGKLVHRLKYLPMIFSLGIMGFFALSVLSASGKSTDSVPRDRQYPNIKKDDAGSCSSRAKHLSKEFAWTLNEQFASLLGAEQNAPKKRSKGISP